MAPFKHNKRTHFEGDSTELAGSVFHINLLQLQARMQLIIYPQH